MLVRWVMKNKSVNTWYCENKLSRKKNSLSHYLAPLKYIIPYKLRKQMINTLKKTK